MVLSAAGAGHMIRREEEGGDLLRTAVHAVKQVSAAAAVEEVPAADIAPASVELVAADMSPASKAPAVDMLLVSEAPAADMVVQVPAVDMVDAPAAAAVADYIIPAAA